MQSRHFQPIHLAAMRGNAKEVRQQLLQGADPSVKVDDYTALDYAKMGLALADDDENKQAFRDTIALLPSATSTALYTRIFKRNTHIQDWLIKRAQTLGFNLKGGACCGIAYMGMQAILHTERDEQGNLLQLENFNQRILRIQSISISSFATHIENILQRNKNKQPLTPEEKIDITIPSFLEGIIQYQQGYKYAWFYRQAGFKSPRNQSPFAIIPVVQSATQAQEGGICCIEQHCNVYQKNDLINYFSELSNHLTQKSSPLALVLLSKTHALVVGYDPIKKQWLLINDTCLPAKIINSTEKLTHLILQSFSSDYRNKKQTNGVIITSQLFTTQTYVAELNNKISTWKASTFWKNIYAINHNKLYFHSDNDDTLYACACRDGLLKAAQQIVANRHFIQAHSNPLLATLIVSFCISALLVGVLTGLSLISLGCIPLIICAIAVITIGTALIICLLQEKRELQNAEKMSLYQANSGCQFFTPRQSLGNHAKDATNCVAFEKKPSIIPRAFNTRTILSN